MSSTVCADISVYSNKVMRLIVLHGLRLHGKTGEAQRDRAESQARLTESKEIDGRTLRYQVQAQTLDRDNIKGRIFRAHDTL